MAHETVVKWYKELMGERIVEDEWDELMDEDLWVDMDHY
jgi:hypothetical protein